MEELLTSHRLFHSFCIKPATRFDVQGDDEHVILVLRSHPITLIPSILNVIFLWFILFFLNFFLPPILSSFHILYLNIFSMVLIGSYFWFVFLNWYFNVGIVSNKRIVDVDFNVVLYKEVTYTLLSHIEDVTSKSGGFFESVFDYGNLFIQTAGSEVNTEFINIPHPSAAAKIIDTVIQQSHQHG